MATPEIILILLASVAIYSFGYGHASGRLSERRRLRLDPPRPTAKSGRDNQALREHITQLEHEVEELKEQLLERVSLHDQASRRFFKERLRAGDLEKRLRDTIQAASVSWRPVPDDHAVSVGERLRAEFDLPTDDAIELTAVEDMAGVEVRHLFRGHAPRYFTAAALGVSGE